MPITYQAEENIQLSSLLHLYNNANWTNYTSNPNSLEKAFRNSLYVCTARNEHSLLGLIRVVGDGHTIIYIQDILVHTDYQRNKIGTTLLRMVLERYNLVRQIVLLTDYKIETRKFYESMGFNSCDDGKLVSFIKINK